MLMQYEQQKPRGLMNNATAIKLLWGGIICYILGLLLPQIEIIGGVDSILIWDILTELGIAIIFSSIVLTYIAITKAKLNASVKKFGITSSAIMLIPLLAISSQLNDLNAATENIFGLQLFEYGAGYYLLLIGAILSAIGSFKAQSDPQYQRFDGYKQSQFGKQSQQPRQYQQPQQPPSYIDPQLNTDRQPISNKSKQYPKTAQQPTPQGKFCGNCGQRNDNLAKFCVNCGQTMN